MATIPGVSDGELIRTSWGDAVAVEVNNSVKKTGPQTMSGSLTLTGSARLNLTGAAPVNDEEAVTKGYVTDYAVSANGELGISGVLQYTAGAAAAVAADDENLAHVGYVNDYAVSGNGDTMSGTLNVGAAAPAHNDNGASVRSDGAVVSAVNTGAAPNSLPNFTAIRGGGIPNDIGGTFARFTSGTVIIGEIEIGPASNQTRYLTSSDYRLKDDLGPVVDALERVGQLRPIRIRWKADGYEQDGFLAHEVDEVVPAAVSGEKDAVDDEGNVDPQMMDNTQLVPLLVAAVQELTARLAVLEAG